MCEEARPGAKCPQTSSYVKSMDTVHGHHKFNSALLLANVTTPIDSTCIYSMHNAKCMSIMFSAHAHN